MNEQWVVAAVAFAGMLPILYLGHALGVRRERLRQRMWRRIAQRAGAPPDLGPWVVARVGGSWLEAGDVESYAGRTRSWRSTLRALFVTTLPEALAVSTSDAQPGVVRARFPAGARTVIVRALDEVEATTFLADGRLAALQAFFTAVPDAVIEARPIDFLGRQRFLVGTIGPDVDWERVTGVVRVEHDTTIPETVMEQELTAFVRLVEALHDPKGAYR